VSQLSRELEIATVIDPSEVETSKIGFGTKITLLNLINNQQEVFTILGPWESQPEKNIISYLSPIGERLLGRSEGETLKFTINDRQFQFQVLKIEKADFS
jgi:transcription elongation GreA/GreB family factor